MEWLEITVRTPADGVEPVSEMFIQFGTGGVVIEDPALILQYERETHPDEWAVSDQPKDNGLSLVKAYLPLEEDGLPGRVEEIKSLVSQMGLALIPEITTRVVAEEDWAEAWKKYYKTVRVGRLVIKPSWEEYQPLGGDLVIEMDPGMAFGCGTHATTALCLTLLEKYVRQGITVYDIGTGSGILAVAAARLGAGRVRAVDIDPVACKAAAENVERNNAGGVVSVEHGNLAELLENGADLVVANIIADVIAGFAPQAASILKPGGVFIASGIIREKADMVRRALGAAGLSVCEDLEEGLWVALVSRKEV